MVSLWTTKYLDVLRNYALPETNQTFDELINSTYQQFWNFDFPWYAEGDTGKDDFKKLFLLHYLMYEIGQETIELHRAMLASRSMWSSTSRRSGVGAVGVMILLRPVTNRLLAPGQRLFLWGAVWVLGYLPQWMALLGWIPFPISLTGW